MTVAEVVKRIGRGKAMRYVSEASEIRKACSKQVLVWQLNETKMGRRLRELRTDSRLSLRELAKLLEVSAPFPHDCEMGHRNLSNLHTILFVYYCENPPNK